MTAMQMEQSGSAMYQPKFCMSNDDIITPTLPKVSTSFNCFDFNKIIKKVKSLPKVSAKTCKKTPCILSFSVFREDEDCLLLFEWEWLWFPPEWLCPCPWELPAPWECEWEWSVCVCDSQGTPPWLWACLNANMPNRFTHKPANETYF